MVSSRRRPCDRGTGGRSAVKMRETVGALEIQLKFFPALECAA